MPRGGQRHSYRGLSVRAIATKFEQSVPVDDLASVGLLAGVLSHEAEKRAGSKPDTHAQALIRTAETNWRSLISGRDRRR